mmetsp:Transcript_8418/g.15846  ORF Transcript_8418/g.15846 Transcript_8418/m.15846 type:complete len:590 (+) Transcript_8418:155-1924(+)
MMGCLNSTAKNKSSSEQDLDTLASIPNSAKPGRSDSVTGQALFKREISTINEAMVQLNVNLNIRKVYDGLGPDEHRRRLLSGRGSSCKKDHEKDPMFLGSGNWGTVRIITRKDDKHKFACKILRLSKNMSAFRRRELMDEMLVLSKLDHPQIAKLYETYEEEGLNLYLVMELLSGGELFKRLTVDSPKGRFTEDLARNATRQMVSAVAYLHSKGIVHRDLKLENFVYRTEGSDDLVLIDFGLSVKYDGTGRRSMMHDVVGSSYYIAPEVLRKNYGIECDVWSLGVIVYMLLSGTPPFKGDTEHKIMASAALGVYSMSRPVWATISRTAQDFVRKCLVKDPKRRMTAKEALSHKWLTTKSVGASQENTEDTPNPLDDDMVKSLRDYVKLKEFKRIALQAVAFSLSHEEISGLEHAFKAIDRDSDGYITFEELKDTLNKHHKLSSSECQDIFDAIDFDKTGKIHFNEFIAASLNENYYHDETVIQHAFSRLDLDHDGLIDLDELKRMCEKSQIQESARINEIVDTVGKTHGKKINVQEFIQLMRSRHTAVVSKVPSSINMDEFLSEEENDPSTETASLDTSGATPGTLTQA